MKISAQSLAIIRQTMMDAGRLLTVHAGEATSMDRRRVIQHRVQELSAAIKLIDESLDTRPAHQEANDG